MITLTFISAGITALAAIVFIYKCYTGTPMEKLIAKGIASTLFLVTAILALLTPTSGSNIPGYGSLLLLGLFFGFVGDVLLEMQGVRPDKQKSYFIAGLLSFLLGHIFYIILLAKFTSVGWLHFGATSAVFALIMIMKALTKSELGKMALPVMAYSLVISLMLGFAIAVSVLVSGQLSLIILVAAVMFFISDVLLAYINFGPKTVKVLRACNLSFYYAAQITLALSLLLR